MLLFVEEEKISIQSEWASIKEDGIYDGAVRRGPGFTGFMARIPTVP